MKVPTMCCRFTLLFAPLVLLAGCATPPELAPHYAETAYHMQ